MSKLQITADQERLARLAKAIGHPTRVAILEFLAKRDECFFGEIHEVLSVSKATVSQHLSELKEVGLIKGTIEPPKVRYCLNCDTWMEAKALFTNLFDECCKNEDRGKCCSSKPQG